VSLPPSPSKGSAPGAFSSVSHALFEQSKTAEQSLPAFRPLLVARI
jgi:hypothetical protein